ncbi:hypothetical protein HanIR_Chr02g0058311 [Helianthus annuus]|nr:hypothetical protein HanIR_Chr02g0058311 [Helianthus annuus]
MSSGVVGLGSVTLSWTSCMPQILVLLVVFVESSELIFKQVMFCKRIVWLMFLFQYNMLCIFNHFNG